jgi:hypothetical protein
MSRDSALLSRRLLLAGLGAGAVGAAAAAAPVLGLRAARGASARPASWWDRSFQSLESAGIAEWTAVVGETFGVETLNGSHWVRIAAVTAFPASCSRPAGLGRSQAFSVAFEPVAGPPLPAADGLYRLMHRAYPPLSVHMGAPSGFGGKTRLIAVFN